MSLDDDVAAKLQTEMRRTGRSMKEIVNDGLRTALSRPRASHRAPRFAVKARDLRLAPGIHLDKVSTLLDDLDGPDHR